MFINANGIERTAGTPPETAQINFVKDILTYVKERKNFTEPTSYGYKHLFESWYPKHYISNGAFILAAQQLNPQIKQIDNSLNAIFKFNHDDLREAYLEYLSKNVLLTNILNKHQNIDTLIDRAKVQGNSTPIWLVLRILSDNGINITSQEMFKLMQHLNIKFKKIFDDDSEKTFPLDLNQKIAISKTKLKELLNPPII